MSKGFRIAEWLREEGITSIVLKYRLPNYGHKEVPLEDAQAAVRYARDHAAELGIDPAKVGVLGGSAGGHLAAYVSTFTPDAEIFRDYLYRDEYYNEDAGSQSVAEVIVAKNRHGSVDKVKLGWIGQYTKFTNLMNGGE